jgi:hypothetical protein
MNSYHLLQNPTFRFLYGVAVCEVWLLRPNRGSGMYDPVVEALVGGPPELLVPVGQ